MPKSPAGKAAGNSWEAGMKIESYAVKAGASRSYQKFEARTVQLNSGGLAAGDEASAVRVTLSGLARQLVAENRGQPAGGQAGGALAAGGVGTGSLPRTKEELKLQMLDEMLFSITGLRVNTRMAHIRLPTRTPRVDGFGVFRNGAASLRMESVQYEREAVAYNARGVVNTADGKRISVDVSLAMSREFFSYASASIQLRPPGNLIDPLVINYGGTAASLTGEKYAFDLTMDGSLEQISFAGPGSGFLVLDKNGDGVINDGSEMFGPATGSGFGELREWDSDGNGWIDENDEVFGRLKIWSKDAAGGDQLFTLLELDIGAIYLGDVATEFSINDAAGNNQGVMRSASFFLKESGGGAGAISHIDLRV